MDYLFILQMSVSVTMLVVLIQQFRQRRKDSRNPPAKALPAMPAEMPLTKPWWRLYGGTLCIALLGMTHISYGVWFVRSNPPPLFEELQTQRVHVLSWRRAHPQLHVRLDNGRDRMVEFPTLRLRGGSVHGGYYYAISAESQRQLVGQTCQIWGRPLRFSLQDSYQVFALECDKGGRLSFEAASKDYEQEFKSSLFFYTTYGIYFYLFVVIFTFWAETIRNRKDRLALQSSGSSSASKG